MPRAILATVAAVCVAAAADAQTTVTYPNPPQIQQTTDPGLAAAIQSLSSKLDTLSLFHQRGGGGGGEIANALRQLNPPANARDHEATIQLLQSLSSKLDTFKLLEDRQFQSADTSRHFLHQEMGQQVRQGGQGSGMQIPTMQIPSMQIPAQLVPMQMQPYGQPTQAPPQVIMVPQENGCTPALQSWKTGLHGETVRQVGPYTIRAKHGLFGTKIDIQ